MKPQRKQEITVGFLVMTAVAIFIGGYAWLAGRPVLGGRRVTVPILFSDVRGLSVGDPVLTSGLQVGRVADVELEDVGRVMVFMELTTDTWRPRIDARAQVKSFDFLGTKFVDYNPGRAEEFLREDQVITGTREADALEGASGLADQAASVLTGIQSFVDESVLNELMATLQTTRRALDAVAEADAGGVAADARVALGRLSDAVGRFDSLAANPDLESAINQLDELTTSLNEMAEGMAGATNALSRILEGMERGEGSAGRLLRDTTLYQNTNDVLVALRRLLDDMREHPGRYFHLNVF